MAAWHLAKNIKQVLSFFEVVFGVASSDCPAISIRFCFAVISPTYADDLHNTKVASPKSPIE